MILMEVAAGRRPAFSFLFSTRKAIQLWLATMQRKAIQLWLATMMWHPVSDRCPVAHSLSLIASSLWQVRQNACWEYSAGSVLCQSLTASIFLRGVLRWPVVIAISIVGEESERGERKVFKKLRHRKGISQFYSTYIYSHEQTKPNNPGWILINPVRIRKINK